MPTPELDSLVAGTHRDPHTLLGPHLNGDGTVIRVLRPDAASVTVQANDDSYPAELVHRGGVFEARLPGKVTDYRLEIEYATGTFTADDPYRFPPTVGEIDRYLFGEGNHQRLWEVLGAHPTVLDGQAGTAFAVWAPHARGVRVMGEFSYWDDRGFPMRDLDGVWELFVPGVGEGGTYKFHVLGADGVWREKADPMAFAAEAPPATASVVHASTYEWGDGAWMDRRAETDWLRAPMSIYEVHLGSWRRGLSYRDLATQLVDYVSELGFTHVELLPPAEHPYGGSWGYQVTSYFAPTARFGRPDEFKHLVDALHRAGIGVIADWVPAHFPKDSWALARFDGTALYEHADPRRGEQPDWGTYVFDYDKPQVRNFLVANALYWLEEYHVDALRVDAVASMLYLDYSRADGQWLPNEYGGKENLSAIAFLRQLNSAVGALAPGAMTIAEESTSWPGVTRPVHLGGLGFWFKWNMGWMHDTLDYLSHEPIYRQYHHQQVTFSMMYAYAENFVLPLSHDEVVHGKGSLLRKMPGDRWNELAGLRALLAYQWAHPGKQLLFMGSELAQESEWAEGRELDWWLLEHSDHAGVRRLVADLNRLYRATPALWRLDHDPRGFQWIDANDAEGNVLSFLRHDPDARSGGQVACVLNFSGVPHEGYRLGLPHHGRWREVLNTDADVYGGSGVGNLGEVRAIAEPYHGQPASVALRVPPLGALWLISD